MSDVWSVQGVRTDEGVMLREGEKNKTRDMEVKRMYGKKEK